jgi:hypothetical protein
MSDFHAGTELHEISRAIGNFEAYIQEFRSGSASLTELIKSNEKLSCERDAELKKDMHFKFDKEVADLAARITNLTTRLNAIDETRMRKEGAVSVGTWFVKNWPTATMMTFLGAFVAWANGLLT